MVGACPCMCNACACACSCPESSAGRPPENMSRADTQERVRPAGTGDASHAATRVRRKKGEGGRGGPMIARPSQTLRMAAGSVGSTGLLSRCADSEL